MRNLDDQSSSKARYATTCADIANRKRTREVCDRSIDFLNAHLDRGIGRHDSFCGTPPSATAPNLIPQRLDCLTSDRVPYHIKPRGPGHFVQSYWIRHRLNKTGLSTARTHLDTALLVISLELLFDPGTGSCGCCGVRVLENRYCCEGAIVYWALKREERGATLLLGIKRGDARQTTPKVLPCLMGPRLTSYVDIFIR